VTPLERRIKDCRTGRCGEIVLWENQVDGAMEYELVINGIFIMASYNHLSSELLVRNAVMPPKNGLHILVGGFGMGYTVKEACSLQGVARIDVVEIEPVIIEWNRTWFENLNSACLEDERVHVISDDFYDYIRRCENQYDLISMDIDNGPMMLVNDRNSRVYRAGFFKDVHSRLNHGGVFAVWSCNHAEGLQQEIDQVFGECRVQEVVEQHQGQNVSYFLYFGRRNS
jgi:spermidine synthase